MVCHRWVYWPKKGIIGLTNFIITGYIYEHGKSDEGVNIEKALEYFRKGADAGSPKAQHNLGYLYALGLHVPQNYTLAIKWYEKAAAQGETVAR